MKQYTKAILAAVILGLLTGAIASKGLGSGPEDYCDRTEDAIISQSNISGAVACFKPGVLDVNLTEKVEKGADLKCVCRRSFDGNVQVWAINKAN